MKKMITMLVIMSLLGFSTSYAHDSEDEDEAAGIALAAGLAFVTTVILLASHDRHEEYLPAPRHPHNRPNNSRGNGHYRKHHDGRYNDNYQSRDYRDNDNDQYRDR